MPLFALEHSKAAYHADFAAYGASVLLLAGYLLLASPAAWHAELQLLTLLGLLSWSAIEYALHRFVLHGLEPFRRWHTAHHQRPNALICAPTVLSASLIGTLVFLPTLLLGTAWHAAALTLGVLGGYLFYAITHHATHHWRAHHPWLVRRRYWHAVHHNRSGKAGSYGVTTTYWDQLLGTYIGQPHSHQRSTWDLAVAACLALIVAYGLYLAWFISRWWCLAAVLSGLLLLYLSRRQATRNATCAVLPSSTHRVRSAKRTLPVPHPITHP
ncbi:sterol desaturase family protein [Chitinimonas naiadis]